MPLQHSLSQNKEFFLAHNSQQVDIRPSDLEIVTEVRRDAVDNGHSQQDDIILQSRSSDIVHFIINKTVIREPFEAKLQHVNARVIWPERGETCIRLQYHEFQFQPMIDWKKDAISLFYRIFRKFSMQKLFVNQTIWNDVCPKIKGYCKKFGKKMNVTYYQPKNEIFLCGLKQAVENVVSTIDEIVNVYTPKHERRSQANHKITALHRKCGTKDNNTNTESHYASMSGRHEHLNVFIKNEFQVYQHGDVQIDVPYSYSQQNKIIEFEVTRNHLVLYDRNGSIAMDTNSRNVDTGPINQTIVERFLYSTQTRFADSKSNFGNRKTHVILGENSKRQEKNLEEHTQQKYLMSVKNIDNHKEKHDIVRIVSPDNHASCRTESAIIATTANSSKKVNTDVSFDLNKTKRQRTNNRANTKILTITNFLGLLAQFAMVIMPVAALPNFPGYPPLVNSGEPCRPKLSESSQPEDMFRKLECYIPTCTNVSKILYEKTGVHSTEQWTPVFEGITKTNYSSLDIGNSYTLSNRYDYYAFQTNHILYIDTSTLEDNGKWRCVVVDAHNTPHESNQVNVKIYEAAMISIPATDMQIALQQTSTFVLLCSGAGYRPNLMWEKDGIHIPHNDERYIIQSKCDSVECTGSITQTMGDSKSECLHIEDYAGIYTCVISLELPYDSSQVSHKMVVYAPENLCNAQGTGLVIGLTIWSSACVITTFIIVAVMVCLIKHRRRTSKDTDQISNALSIYLLAIMN